MPAFESLSAPATRATSASPPVLLLYETDAPFETIRLATTLAGRIDGAAAMPFTRAQWAAVWRRVTDAVRLQPDTVIHAFGGPALAAALLAGRAAIFYTATHPPTRRDIAWLRAATRYRPVKVICDSDTDRRRWLTGGLTPERCVLIRPGVSMSNPPAARTAARQRLGIEEGQTLLFAPLPVTGETRKLALWTGSLMHVIDSKFKLAVWNPPGGPDLATLRTRLIDPAILHVIADPTPEAGFAAADAVLLPGEGLSPTITAMAMASGRPIVALLTPQYCELIEDRHTALLATTATPRALAARVSDVVADPALARSIADRARAEAYDLFLLSRLVGDYRNVYASAVGAAVDVVHTA